MAARVPRTVRLALSVLAATMLFAAAAWAQDDGPRVYQLAPLGAQSLTAFAVVKRGDEGPEPGDIVLGSEIDTNILVLRYARTFSLGGRAFSPFVIVPMGEVESRVQRPEGLISTSSSGLGDAQLGGVLGLVGAPALSRDAYAAFQPGFSLGLFGRVFFPTGAYSAAKPVNLGSNRFAYQLGLTGGFAWGGSYLDPALTTLDVLPTVTFYDDNHRPYGANIAAKDPLFTVEGHLTRNLGRDVWVSADVLWRQGGETFTDGAPDDNGTRGWAAGLTAAVRVDPRATLIFTYHHVVERSDGGPDGWFFRSVVVVPF